MSTRDPAVIDRVSSETSAMLMDHLLDQLDAHADDASELLGVAAGAAMATAEIFLAIKGRTAQAVEYRAQFIETMAAAWDNAASQLAAEGHSGFGKVS